MKRYSELTFKDLLESNFGAFIKVIWNGLTVYEDTDDYLSIDGTLASYEDNGAFEKFKEKYGTKKVYTFYCRVVSCHHTELYIEGER